MSGPVPTTMRIGELAARCGVSAHTLRAWERRYGLLRPQRSTGGYRVYDAADERRVRSVLALREAGVSATEAARRVLEAERAEEVGRDPGAVPPAQPEGAAVSQPPAMPAAMPPAGDGSPVRPWDEAARSALYRAMLEFDEHGAHAAVDRALAHHDIAEVIVEVIMPFLVQVGRGWQDGEVGIAQEHFVSHVLRSRMAAYAHTWGMGSGPVAVLACPEGELHDLALVGLGVCLGRSGWRVRYLGPNTPVAALEGSLRSASPDAVVVSATRAEATLAAWPGIVEIARRLPVWVAGPALADPQVAARVAQAGVVDSSGSPTSRPGIRASMVDPAAMARAMTRSLAS